MTTASLVLVALLGAEPQECVDQSKSLDEVRCDDGSPLVDVTGTVNERCVLEGCNMFTQSCWTYRLDHCYDDGILNGQCTLKSETCTSPTGCLWLWAWCDGTLKCAEGGIKSGWCVCTTDG